MALNRTGPTKAARMPRMMITITSSTSEKPSMRRMGLVVHQHEVEGHQVAAGARDEDLDALARPAGTAQGPPGRHGADIDHARESRIDGRQRIADRGGAGDGRYRGVGTWMPAEPDHMRGALLRNLRRRQQV